VLIELISALETELETRTGKAHLHCLGIGRNADVWTVVSVSALYGASAAAYAGKTRLKM